ncbi:MAG: membrane dipeptidase [Chitinophagaceae bacterium]|jgi:membrane dipeptidase|nr:membrane dipeptidase [Chitinophagaceae bacterium]
MEKLAFLLAFVVLQLVAFNQSVSNPVYERSESEAKTIVQKVLKQSPVIDGHNDLLRYYYDCRSCPRELDAYRLDTITSGHTDIVRWKSGGVGAQLLNVFGNTFTARNLLDAYDLVYRMTEKYGNDLIFATSSTEIRKAFQKKKIAIVPAMEFSIRLENSPAMVRIFHRLGLRAVTLAYQTNDLADGSDDTAKHNGLSTLGKEMVMEMNRTGIMVDISHVSEKSMIDVLQISEAPVIFSHSNAKALCNVNRNVSDEVLKKLKSNGGIIMLTFVPYFTTQAFADWYKKGDEVWMKLKNQHKDSLPLAITDMEKWEKENTPPTVNVADIADHFDYVKKVAGVNHIGIGSDFDGIEYVIKGLEDVSTFPNLLIELARRGWTEAELRKITGENFLRVFERVEKIAAMKVHN